MNDFVTQARGIATESELGGSVQNSRIKKLAIAFTELATAQGADERELVSALALAAGATIRARWPISTRDAVLQSATRIMKLAKEQL